MTRRLLEGKFHITFFFLNDFVLAKTIVNNSIEVDYSRFSKLSDSFDSTIIVVITLSLTINSFYLTNSFINTLLNNCGSLVNNQISSSDNEFNTAYACWKAKLFLFQSKMSGHLVKLISQYSYGNTLVLSPKSNKLVQGFCLLNEATTKSLIYLSVFPVKYLQLSKNGYHRLFESFLAFIVLCHVINSNQQLLSTEWTIKV